jgi:hypothetical protein
MPGPFVGSTENYVSLALKRMIRWAAENDYDRIAWPPGVVHAERYNLAQHVDELFYTTKDGSVGTLVGRKGGRDIVSHDGVPADKLGDYVGQDAARKLLDREPETVRGADQYYLTGRDLAQMGGEGMKGFYDQILPATAQKLGKKFGARVGQSEITTSPADLAQARARAEAAGNTAFLERNPTQSQSVHSLDITPEMKQSVLKEGQPLFAGVPFDPASAAVGAGAGAASGEEGEADPGRTAAGMVVAGLLGRRFPGVAAAQAAAQKRAAALAARGQAPLSPLQWTRKLVGTAGYSSMIGPATATVNVFGNLLEPLWAIPKEAARSITPRRLGGRGNPREFGEMALGAFHGMGQTGQAIVDALAARGRYASNPDHPHLSEQTVNPIGHAIAASLEAGGRVFSGLPDAVFGTIARSAGEARRAAQIATDEGLTGAPWKQRVQGLLQDVEQHRGAQGATPSPQVDDIIKSGEQYADRQTFRDELGTVGKGAAAMAGRNVPVVGNLLTPFFNTPWNMGVALAERTPVGAVMNRQKGFDKAYDAVVGTALVAGLAFGPVAAGKITGSGPDDPEKRKMLQAEGWRPYHTLVGDTYIPNRVFGIYGKLLNAAGEVHDALAFQKKDATAREMSGDAFRRFGKLLKEEPYLQGLADIMAAITDPQAGGVEGYVAQNVTRLLPYAATTRTIGTAQDTNERETDRGRDVSMTESVSQRVQQGVGARSELPVAQDVMGRPRENQTPGIWSVLPKFSQKRAEPLVRAYLDAGVDIGTPPDKIDNVPLKPAQQRRYREVMGRELERIAGPTIRGAGWANMPPQVKKQLLETFQSAARVLAETAVSSEGGSKFAEDRAKATVDKALGR